MIGWELVDFVMRTLIFGLLSIPIHEYGHVYAFRRMGKTVEPKLVKGTIVVGKPSDYKGLNKKQLQGIYGIGVLMGFLPILFGVLIVSPIVILFVFPYVGWCWNDLKNYRKYSK